MRFVFFLMFFLSTSVWAADWNQFLGPTRDSQSPEKLAVFQDAPTVLWRKAVGPGHSSPVVAGGKVYLHTLGPDSTEVLHAFEAENGNEVFKQSYSRGIFFSPFGLGPRATPTVVDGKVVTLGVTGILSCFDAIKGEKRWQVDVLKAYNAKNLRFGVSTSPLIENGLVYVNVGGQAASVVAFDLATGKEVWKSESSPASYSSPIALGNGKSRQLVFLTGDGLLSLSPTDGKVFWKHPLKDKLNESSTTPVRLGQMLLAASVTTGSIGLKLAGDELTVEPVWKDPAFTCYFSTPVALDGEHVLMVTGSIVPPPSVTLRCVNIKTGKELWKKPAVGKYHAALVKTAESVLMLEDTGHLSLLAPSTQNYQPLCRAKVCGDTWAHPAIADGRVYLRDDKEVICLKLSQ